MKTKHIFVSVLDVNEILPFRPKKRRLKDSLSGDDVNEELSKFVDVLSKSLKEPIWYMGMDIIGSKNYERFIFENGGFFEIMVDAPIAMNAHFVHKPRANKFKTALKKTLKEILPKEPVINMFVDSIEVQSESQDNLTVSKWSKIKDLRNLKF